MISDLDLVGQRLAGEAGLDIGIVDIATEVAFDLDVLLIAVGAHALIALRAVFGAQFVDVEIQPWRCSFVAHRA